MRRLIIEEPYAQSAIWTRRLALIGAGGALTAIALAHRVVISPLGTIGVLVAALACGLLALLYALSSAVIIWRTGRKGTGRTLVGVCLAALTLAYPAYLAAKVARQPIVTDMSTSPKEPPRFSLSTRAYAFRGDLDADHAGDPLEPGAADSSDLEAAVLDETGADALKAVLKVVTSLHWRVIDSVAPGGRLGLGHVDAVSYSAVMHLPEDIAIRITPLAGQSRIDVRSRSRFGLHDFGDNAANIHAMLDALQDQDDEK